MRTIKYALIICVFISVNYLFNTKANAYCLAVTPEGELSETEQVVPTTDVVYEKDGDYSHIVSSGDHSWTYACDPNPDEICYCYDKVNEVATIDPNGENISIHYVKSIEYLGTYLNPYTGAQADWYEITTEQQ